MPNTLTVSPGWSEVSSLKSALSPVRILMGLLPITVALTSARVAVGVKVGLFTAVGDRVGVSDGVAVKVGVGVGVTTLVAVAVAVWVGVSDGVNV